MTLDQLKLARLGSRYWQTYVELNGYAFEPNRKGLLKLATRLELPAKTVGSCIYLYLNA